MRNYKILQKTVKGEAWRDESLGWIDHVVFSNILFFLRFCLFLDRGGGREKEGERHQCVVASHAPPTGDLACNPGLCPDWELNQRPFGSQAGAQSTEPHQPGLLKYFNKI